MPDLDMLSARLLSSACDMGPVMLMYHSIQLGSTRPRSQWSVSYSDFCAQLDLLLQYGWRTARVCDLQDSGSFPPRTLVITFDDGYADNMLALEALQKRDMQASWFVVTDDIGGRVHWQDADFHGEAMLDRAQLREMHAAGMELGSHSCSHRALDEASGALLRSELADSKNYLEQLLGEPVVSLAYPYGRYQPETMAAARAAGYMFACSCKAGRMMADFDPLQLRRIAVFNNDGLRQFARKLAFADNEAGWGKVARYYAGRLMARLS